MDQQAGFESAAFDDPPTPEMEQQLRCLFAEAARPLSTERFERQFALSLQRAQRRQRLQFAIAALVSVIALMFLSLPVIQGSAAMSRWISESTLGFGDIFMTRTGWVCSFLIAGWVLMKARVFRRW